MSKHIILDTAFGEVCIKDSETIKGFSDVYIGDNYDQWVGSIHHTIAEDEATLKESVERMLNK
jgi:hypothetical protein